MRRLFEERRRLMLAGARHVAGVDEVGVGPLAGPVVAAAVVMKEDSAIRGVNDSPTTLADLFKKLSMDQVGRHAGDDIVDDLPLEGKGQADVLETVSSIDRLPMCYRMILRQVQSVIR